MARVGFLKTILPVAIGFALMPLSRSFEQRGDFASAMGDPAGALSGHFAALLVTVASIACFGYALYHFFRRGPSGGAAAPEEIERVVDPVESSTDEKPFDPDAIMARYLANRDPAAARAYDSPTAPPATPPAAPPAPASARPSFGRKRA